MTKIGIFSFAHLHATSYAACLQQIEGVELVGIYDEDPTRGQEMAARFDCSFYNDTQSLLDEGLEGVIVCSENSKHRAMVEAAAGQVAAHFLTGVEQPDRAQGAARADARLARGGGAHRLPGRGLHRAARQRLGGRLRAGIPVGGAGGGAQPLGIARQSLARRLVEL